jgi:hypothetical protein
LFRIARRGKVAAPEIALKMRQRRFSGGGSRPSQAVRRLSRARGSSTDPLIRVDIRKRSTVRNA